MAREEIVTKWDPKPKPGWPCPKCRGLGNMANGCASWAPGEHRYTPPTKCSLCDGVGRVECTPAART